MPDLQHKPKLWGYLGLAVFFFALSYLTVLFMHSYFSGGKLTLPPASAQTRNAEHSNRSAVSLFSQ